jgi:hypothetical protein
MVVNKWQKEAGDWAEKKIADVLRSSGYEVLPDIWLADLHGALESRLLRPLLSQVDLVALSTKTILLVEVKNWADVYTARDDEWMPIGRDIEPDFLVDIDEWPSQWESQGRYRRSPVWQAARTRHMFESLFRSQLVSLGVTLEDVHALVVWTNGGIENALEQMPCWREAQIKVCRALRAQGDLPLLEHVLEKLPKPAAPDNFLGPVLKYWSRESVKVRKIYYSENAFL